MIKEKRLLCTPQNNIGKKIFSPSSVNFIIRKVRTDSLNTLEAK